MKIISIDTETTGLDTNTCEVIELGYALFDLEKSKDAPMIMKSTLVIPKGEITEEITDITGITAEMVDQYGVNSDEAFLELVNVMNTHQPEIMLGHNLLDYDLPIIARYLDMIRPFAKINYQPTMVDSRVDLPHKRPPKNNSLIFLSADIAKFCNPFAHRALFDSMATMKLLSCFDIQSIYQQALFPIIEIRADVSFSGKDLAKKAGFNWDGERKIWVKNIREATFSRESARVNFPILKLDQKRIAKL
jgi:DNA polymerase-3 subunit epsilon